jgi:hypothetical protein
MKKTSFLCSSMAVIGLILLFASCSKFPDNSGNDLTVTGKSSLLNSIVDKECNFNVALTDVEKEGLLYMREEEKVARDVYLEFFEQYGDVIFKKIADSEQAHMDAILYLIVGYGLVDPVAGKETGEFTDTFQPVYDNYIATGTNLVEAFEVGVSIEEIDIADLEKYLSITEVLNLVQTYSKLLAASEKHLSAFNTRLLQ